MKKITPDTIREQLKNVLDPELGINIVDMGLIYDIKVTSKNHVTIDMTLTTPACPLGPQITTDIKDNLKEITDIKKVKIELVWKPAWNRDMMTNDAKEMLNMGW